MFYFHQHDDYGTLSGFFGQGGIIAAQRLSNTTCQQLDQSIQPNGIATALVKAVSRGHVLNQNGRVCIVLRCLAY
jgi:hypothetical protein